MLTISAKIDRSETPAMSQQQPTVYAKHEQHRQMARCITDGIALVEEGAALIDVKVVSKGWSLIELGCSLAINEQQQRQLAMWVMHRLRPLV
jgi:hypothetical protein